MRSALLLSLSLATAGTALAASEPYYNPANVASPSGLTTGHELYRTIGCPGQGLFDTDCAQTPAVTVEAPAPVTAPVVVQAPAPVVVEAPAPVVVQAPAPAPATTVAYPNLVNPLALFCPLPKQ